MTGARVRVADDCAVLPSPAGPLVYQGATGRVMRVPPAVGRWLVRGTLPGEMSDEDMAKLLALAILRPGAGRFTLNMNSFAPQKAAGWALIAVLMFLGTAAWVGALSRLPWVLASVLPEMTRRPEVWVWVPFVLLALSVVHEWGHVVALRALGGRAGWLQTRFGWPWLVIEVGPFQTALAPGARFVLVAGGIVSDVVVLGLALAGIVYQPASPVLCATAVVAGTFVLFNLFPTPWSDGGQLLVILVRGALDLMRGRTGYD